VPAPLPEVTRRRITALVVGRGLGYRETVRRLAQGSDGGPPVKLHVETVRRTVHRARRDGELDVRPVALAGRMLRLLERELCAIEGQGTLDLERLDKLAATLRRLEPLRPASGGSDSGRPVGLMSLMDGHDGSNAAGG
jgi:hypothetical protein